MPRHEAITKRFTSDIILRAILKVIEGLLEGIKFTFQTDHRASLPENQQLQAYTKIPVK